MIRRTLAALVLIGSLGACAPGTQRIDGDASWTGEVTTTDSSWHLHIDSADVDLALATMTPTTTATSTVTNTPTATATNTPLPTSTPAPTSEDNVDISFVNVGALAASATTSLSPAIPTIQAGDLLVTFIATSSNSGAPTTVPTGWTVDLNLGPFQSGVANNSRYVVYWKIADGSESGTAPTYVFAATTTLRIGMVAAYRGVHATTPMDVTSAGAGGSNNSPSLTTVHDLSLHIAIMAWAGGATLTSGPSGYTQRANAASGTRKLAIFDKVISPAGATGTAVWTLSFGTPNFTGSLAIRDVDSPDPVTSARGAEVVARIPGLTVIPASDAGVTRLGQ